MSENLPHKVSIWNRITSTRVFISNLFFLTIILFIVVMVLGSLFFNNSPDPTNKALIFNPAGPIVEQVTQDNPFSEFLGVNTPKELSLNQSLEILNKAKSDERLKYIILSLENIQGTGQSTLYDLGQSIKAIRESGKKVIETNGKLIFVMSLLSDVREHDLL